jgi:penicillin-insensitive murein endopeptidase
VRLLKRVAAYPEVERVLVHPAIKKAVCDATANDKDRGWLSKIRAYWGHYYHFHVRIGCPKGSTGCERQPPVGGDDGCGAELTRWLAKVKTPPRPLPPGVPRREKRPITLDQLPRECRTVLDGAPPAPTVTAKGTAKPAAVAAKAKSTAPKKATAQ